MEESLAEELEEKKIVEDGGGALSLPEELDDESLEVIVLGSNVERLLSMVISDEEPLIVVMLGPFVLDALDTLVVIGIALDIEEDTTSVIVEDGTSSEDPIVAEEISVELLSVDVVAPEVDVSSTEVVVTAEEEDAAVVVGVESESVIVIVEDIGDELEMGGNGSVVVILVDVREGL
jgi:hypothetical protein